MTSYISFDITSQSFKFINSYFIISRVQPLNPVWGLVFRRRLEAVREILNQSWDIVERVRFLVASVPTPLILYKTRPFIKVTRDLPLSGVLVTRAQYTVYWALVTKTPERVNWALVTKGAIYWVVGPIYWVVTKPARD